MQWTVVLEQEAERSGKDRRRALRSRGWRAARSPGTRPESALRGRRAKPTDRCGSIMKSLNSEFMSATVGGRGLHEKP
jgi:hypothetical protein